MSRYGETYTNIQPLWNAKSYYTASALSYLLALRDLFESGRFRFGKCSADKETILITTRENGRYG